MSDWQNTSIGDRLGAITSWFKPPRRKTEYGGGGGDQRGLSNEPFEMPQTKLDWMESLIARDAYTVGKDRLAEEELAVSLGWDGQGSMYDYLSEVGGREIGIGDDASLASPVGVVLRRLIETATGGSTIGVHAPERDGMMR